MTARTSRQAAVAAALCGLLASPIAAQNVAAARAAVRSPGSVERLSVERDGGRTVVHVIGTALGSATLSEPFHLADHTRVYLLIEDVTHAPDDLAATLPEEAPIAISTEKRDGVLRLTVDAAAIGDYGIEPREDGLALWIEEAPAAAGPLAAAESFAAAETIPAPASVRHAFNIRVAAAGILVLLVLPIFTWRFVARRIRPGDANSESPADVTADRPSVRMGDARLWAARTLAAEGLDAAEIAERTGLSRDAAALLVLGTHAAKAAAPGRNFRSPRSAGHRARSGSHGIDH